MSFLELRGGRIEYAWIEEASSEPSTIVMLHEGLGSLSAWRDFPGKLARSTRSRVLAYSRFGYGQSTSLAVPRAASYLHDEAWSVLPDLLGQLKIERPILFGHSDGASIALIHASRHPVECVVALAPHVFVEALSLTGIAAAKVAYERSDLRQRLARHHADVDGAFRGWNDAWLRPDFQRWNIEELLAAIDCPVLAIQGEGDEYGTVEQLHRLRQGAREAECLLLPGCGHFPHREQSDTVLASVTAWLGRRQARQPAPAR